MTCKMTRIVFSKFSDLASLLSPVGAVLCPGHACIHKAHEAAEVSMSQSRHLEAGGQVSRVGEHEAGQELGLETHNRPAIT